MNREGKLKHPLYNGLRTTVERLIDDCKDPFGYFGRRAEPLTREEKGEIIELLGFIYFIKEAGGEYIKVGWAANPFHRMAQLQTSNPRALELIGYVVADMPKEKRLHEELTPYRVTGEWYRDCAEIRERIDRLLKGGSTGGAN
jgi:hypothetical protein